MTVKIGIAGIQGRMGREIGMLATNDPEITLIGGLGRSRGADDARELPILCDPRALLPQIDVLIDFSVAAATADLADLVAETGTPLVTGTTGLDAGQSERLRAAAARAPIFQAANMSLGVNAILALLPLLVRSLAGYDLEIVEAHHRHKVDAPSGTALALARALAAASGDPLDGRARYGREGAPPRGPGEIGIHAVRGGGNPGEHAVIIAGDGEEVRIAHRAFGRAAYAEGALRAAKRIVRQPPGWYDPATLPGFLPGPSDLADPGGFAIVSS